MNIIRCLNFLSLYTLLLCSSCSSQNRSTPLHCNLQREYFYLEFDSINYPKTLYTENFYLINDTNYYIYFNDRCNCFYIRKLFDNNFNYSILLKDYILKEFPFKQFKEAGILPISNDSVIIFNEKKILIIDKNSNVIDSILVNKNIRFKNGVKSNNVYFISGTPNMPYYFKNTNEVLFEVGSTVNRKYADTYLEALLNLTDKSFRYVSIKFPKEYDYGNYGVVPTNFHRTISGTKIVYTFGITPDIYVYDIIKDTVTVYKNCRSSYQIGDIKPIQKKRKLITNDDMYNYEKYDQHYHNIGHDIISGNYYRIFRPKMNVKNENGEYNTFKDKKMILQVFDSNFNILCEEVLDYFDYHTWYMLSTKRGMAYSVINKDKKYSIKFRFLK